MCNRPDIAISIVTSVLQFLQVKKQVHNIVATSALQFLQAKKRK